MLRSFNKLEKDTFRVVSLAGAGLYLALLSASLIIEDLLGRGDFLSSTIEPFLLFIIGGVCFVESFNIARTLPDDL